MESFANSCRLCLWKGDKMLPIFTSPDDEETASKIRKCLPLDVRWEDNLPKGICASCLYKVEMLYEFHCSSVRVDSLLRKYLTSEVKDSTIREQQLSSSGYQVAGVHLMRSVAIGTEDDEDEYGPLARTARDGGGSSADAEPVVARVRVRTPFDICDTNSVGASPMVLLPLRQSDLRGSDGSNTTVGALARRLDSAQGIDSLGVHAEQSATSSAVMRLSTSGATLQQEHSGQPEAEEVVRTLTTGDTDVVCLSMRSSTTVMQNNLSASHSCECSGDDDEVVVLAEYQKPSRPNRRSKTPTPFDNSCEPTSTSTATAQGDGRTLPRQKTQRLCARHQEFLRLMNLRQWM